MFHIVQIMSENYMKSVNKPRLGAQLAFPDIPRKRAQDQIGMQVGERGAIAEFNRAHRDENSKFFNKWAAQESTQRRPRLGLNQEDTSHE